MANNYFSFKRFTIHQDRCAMKVGTDGVLLGVLAPTIDSGRILDIGTGTGLVGIMLSQRCPQAMVTGVELDANAAKQAEENATSTGWKIKIINKSIQDFSSQCEEKFDLIVSNPPYFINSLKAPEKNRNTARHTDELSFEELIESAEKLLSEEGKFSVIIPYSEEENFIGIANKRNLIAESSVRIIPKVGKDPKRSVITFCRCKNKINCNINVTELVIEKEERHCYSDEFKKLTADFYLKH
ncbi:MAG: methyltransferase [Paludibacteraceae bacterium]|nr:methyltransferase [Paludibacteraceae bacterium]